MKILVTGGAGFIGSAVAKRYIAAGHSVSIVDDFSSGFKERVPREAHLYSSTICNHGYLADIFETERPDVVSHHAAQMDVRASVRLPLQDADTNILGSISVLEACVRHGVKKIIFASSGGAIYGESGQALLAETAPKKPISHYGASKLSVEHYLDVYQKLHGLKYVSLRYTNVYGPGQSPYREAGVIAIFGMKMLCNQPVTIYGNGSKTRDYVFIQDVVDANVMALHYPECAMFNVGCGVHVTDQDIFDAIAKVTGYKQKPIFAPARAGEVDNIAVDVTAASRFLGWRPKTELTKGIARTIARLREEK